MSALPAQAYAELVRAVCDLVERYLPAGSSVAVVSRGDPSLVDLARHEAVHVPSTEDGKYAGYHPSDGPDAVRAVESARSRGADFLLVPETSSWWLTHYDGLREHLGRLGPPVVVEPGVASVFPLSGRPSLLDREATERTRVLDDLADIAGLLLPSQVTVMAVGPEGELDSRLPGLRVETVDPGVPAPALPRSASFLLVPCRHFDWLERTEVRQALDRRGRLVTWQEHVGAIYELLGPGRDE